MTGYQKLKRENIILWQYLRGLIHSMAVNIYKDNPEQQEQFKEREIAWIEKNIRDSTK